MSPWLKIGLPSSLATLALTLAVANLGDQQKDIDYELHDVAPVTSRSFRLTLENLMGPSLVDGNRVTALQNGDQIFPAMLDAIRGARDTINFESYIYLSGKIGDQFRAVLIERAQAGVQVRLLIDWVGSQTIQHDMIEQLRAAGVDVQFYHPLSWYSLTRMNNRTHRKLLIVDGTLGFTGGVGISDEWTGNADSPDHWRDSQFKVTGPVVGQMQAAFADNWTATSPQVLHGERFFPPIKPQGPSQAQMFKSAPREGAASAQMMYLLAIAAAHEELLIQNAYFVPGKLAIKALLEARARGVRVRVIVPGPIIDSETTRLASRDTWGPLLEKGIEIYEYQPTMSHVKLMIVDRALVSVGSTNFDDRSFRLNAEANLNVIDPAFAKAMRVVFEADLPKSKQVTLEAWRARPFKEKVLGWILSGISNQL
jgi:cardiolipin synthase